MDDGGEHRVGTPARDHDTVMDAPNRVNTPHVASPAPDAINTDASAGQSTTLPPPSQLSKPTILPPLPLSAAYGRPGTAGAMGGPHGGASVPGTPLPMGFVESGPVTPGLGTAGGSQPASPGSAGRPLNVKDALSYLELVKVKFENWPDVYNQFLDIMKDFKSQVIDTPGVIERVSTLFSGHPTLIQGFNTFLPAGYRIECTPDNVGGTSVTVTTPSGTMTTHSRANMASLSSVASGAPSLPPLAGIPWASAVPSPMLPVQIQGPPHTPGVQQQMNPFDVGPSPGVNGSGGGAKGSGGQPAEFNHAIEFVNKIKLRFAQEPETYKQFLEILQKYQKEQRPYQEVFHQVSALFKGSPDLIDEFKQFLPDPAAGQHNAAGNGLLLAAGEIGRGEMDRERLDKKKVGNASASAAAEKAAVPKRKKRVHEEKPIPAKPAQQPKAKRSKHHHVSKPEPQSPTYAEPSPLPSHAHAQNGTHHSHHHVSHHASAATHPNATNGASSSKHVGGAEDMLFFDRIKKFFDDKAKYHDFLKLLNMFTQEIIDARTLVERAVFFLGDGDMLQQLKDILGYDDRDVIIEPDSGLRGNSSVVAALDRPKVDLNTCKKYGPSYRKLPKEEVSLACSGRDAMCWDVLNDEWVSHPTWASEDTGFTTHKKNVYEEALHKSEEERHEYDFHVEAITRTIQILEPIMSRIQLMDNDERTHFKLKPGLGGQGKSIYQRVIKKVYGKDHGAEIITALHESPSIAVPVVLNRLKQKDDEWKRAQREWNKVWREVDGRNYYKSLDHQGVNFKANDKKAWTARNLIQEIEAKRLEQSRERAKFTDPLMARTQPKDHYAFRVDDIRVLQDCVKLVLVFLDRTTTAQYSRADRLHVESFLHSFVPLFFMIDQAEYDAGLAHQGAPTPAAASIPLRPAGEDGAGSDDAASDSVMDEAADDTVSGASTPTGRGKGKKGSAAQNGAGPSAGDLRKKILKSGAHGKSAKGSQPPSSRASPAGTPATHTLPLGDHMAVDGEAGPSHAGPTTVFSTAEGESWVKYTSTDPNAKQHSVFKPRASDVPGRKSNFFANNHIYVLLRQLQTLYSRLHQCKNIAEDLASDNSGWHLANPVAVQLGFHDTIGPGNTRLIPNGPNPAKDFYSFTLACCEQLFDNQMEMAVFEDNLRFMYDIKAYTMFTIDKLVAAIVKQIQQVIGDARCQDLISLLRKERVLETFTTQQLINYRREAEAIIGPEENLYRICWIVPTNIMQIQLLGRDDISTDDAKTLTDRWRQYIESYTLPHRTEGLPDDVPPPFLRRTRDRRDEESEPVFISRAALQIKICIRTYRLFFVSGTEDFFWRTRTTEEVEKVKKESAERRTLHRGLLDEWLAKKIPSSEVGTDAEAVAPAGEAEVDAEMSSAVKEEAPQEAAAPAVVEGTA